MAFVLVNNPPHFHYVETFLQFALPSLSSVTNVLDTGQFSYKGSRDCAMSCFARPATSLLHGFAQMLLFQRGNSIDVPTENHLIHAVCLILCLIFSHSWYQLLRYHILFLLPYLIWIIILKD